MGKSLLRFSVIAACWMLVFQQYTAFSIPTENQIEALFALYGKNTSNEEAKIRHKRNFVCPGDGKWPDETDCGKYHTCSGSTDTSGWCGPGMSFDVDNQRCEMALAINCRDGDRPDWKPPENWQGKTKETTTTTKKSASTKGAAANSQTTPKSENSIKEKDRCNFQGLMPDKENCGSYFYCKENEARKESCPERQLFDEETKGCKEFKNVYCGDRPVNDKGKDQCRSRPNGVYPNLETGCSEFYQCTSQRKVKSGECPQGLKFNLLTLRCDWANNVPIPCGTKITSSGMAYTSGFVNMKLLTFLLTNILFKVYWF